MLAANLWKEGLFMLEIRFHGRGGQGAVTSVELLAAKDRPEISVFALAILGQHAILRAARDPKETVSSEPASAFVVGVRLTLGGLLTPTTVSIAHAAKGLASNTTHRSSRSPGNTHP